MLLLLLLLLLLPLYQLVCVRPTASRRQPPSRDCLIYSVVNNLRTLPTLSQTVRRNLRQRYVVRGIRAQTLRNSPHSQRRSEAIRHLVVAVQSAACQPVNEDYFIFDASDNRMIYPSDVITE